MEVEALSSQTAELSFSSLSFCWAMFMSGLSCQHTDYYAGNVPGMSIQEHPSSCCLHTQRIKLHAVFLNGCVVL
eukprot:2352853-Amphidinium_carterae.1